MREKSEDVSIGCIGPYSLKSGTQDCFRNGCGGEGLFLKTLHIGQYVLTRYRGADGTTYLTGMSALHIALR